MYTCFSIHSFSCTFSHPLQGSWLPLVLQFIVNYQWTTSFQICSEKKALPTSTTSQERVMTLQGVAHRKCNKTKLFMTKYPGHQFCHYNRLERNGETGSGSGKEREEEGKQNIREWENVAVCAEEKRSTQPSYDPYALQIMLTLCGHHVLCKLFECCNSVLYIFMLQEEHGTCLPASWLHYISALM